MAEKSFINPDTGALRCPINGFRDCVKSRCFLWRGSDELDLMFEHLRPTELTDRSEFTKDNCLLLAQALLAEPMAFATRLVLEAHDSLPRIPPEPEPPSPPPPPRPVKSRRELREQQVVDIGEYRKAGRGLRP